MKYAACIVPAASVKAGPAFETEMVNELLFGEKVELRGEEGAWKLVAGLQDGYEGWIQASQLQFMEEQEALLETPWITADWLTTLQTPEGPMLVPRGSSLPDWDGQQARIGDLLFRVEGPVIDRRKRGDKRSYIAQLTDQWLNVPYRWGGRTPLGIDCSGLTQLLYKMLGIDLPRDADPQARVGELVAFLPEARMGDLAFFDDGEGRIIHTGILTGDGHIVHSAGKVRRDLIDQAGILHRGSGQRTHRLRLIKRYF